MTSLAVIVVTLDDIFAIGLLIMIFVSCVVGAIRDAFKGRKDE